jgi:hypothetical protein
MERIINENAPESGRWRDRQPVSRERTNQAKFLATKSQLTRFQYDSTYLARRLR